MASKMNWGKLCFFVFVFHLFAFLIIHLSILFFYFMLLHFFPLNFSVKHVPLTVLQF